MGPPPPKANFGVQFYRQKPIGNYIVDFYAPAVRLIVEIDGSQHLEPDQARRDEFRTAYFNQLGLRVLRFTITKYPQFACREWSEKISHGVYPQAPETIRDDPMLIIVIPREARNLSGSERLATESYH